MAVLKASEKSTMQEVSVGYPKLREEWVTNALCGCRDAQEWEGVTVWLACYLSLFPYSSFVSPAQLFGVSCMASKKQMGYSSNRYLCSVRSAARAKEGASAQRAFKNCAFYHCNIAERCALNHTMCLLVGLPVSSEGQAGGDGPSYGTSSDIKKPCSSVFPSLFQCASVSSLF